MKTGISFLLLIALFFNSCKKNNVAKNNDGPAVFLSQIFYLTGDTAAVFSYNGKQLAKATYYYENAPGIPIYKQVNNFTYNANGQVTNITITYPTGYYYITDPMQVSVVYNGNNIAEVDIIQQGKVIDDNTFNYQNGLLNNWLSSLFNYNITYNANGNVTSIGTLVNTNNTTYSTINLAFDNYHTPISALPNSVYFIASSDFWLLFPAWTPGANNVLASNKTNSYTLPGTSLNIAYHYSYNSYGYPSQVTITGDPENSGYTYEYITIN